ncbi:MAG TPA: hypothetical protein VEY69_14560 [Lautropia sp.]|jgi:hypothetical protein|nr:hypothetical protein [Lautropia sp.]
MIQESSTCYAPLCGYSVAAHIDNCPECGRKMVSARSVRRRGLVMLASGGFVSALVGAIAFMLAPMFASDSFTGTAEQARTIIQLFWLLILFGAAGAGAGAWQYVTGRRNRFVTTGVLALAGLVVFAARVTDLTLSLPAA